MIVWTGKGGLAVVIALVGGALGRLVAGALGMGTSGQDVGTGLGLLLGAVGVWVVGTRLNAPSPESDTAAGDGAPRHNAHTFMFIPMQWTAPIVAVLGVVLTALEFMG